MTSARPRSRPHLHPLTSALALLAVAILGAAGAAASPDRAAAWAALVLLPAAGAAAGFANSGST